MCGCLILGSVDSWFWLTDGSSSTVLQYFLAQKADLRRLTWCSYDESLHLDLVRPDIFVQTPSLSWTILALRLVTVVFDDLQWGLIVFMYSYECEAMSRLGGSINYA